MTTRLLDPLPPIPDVSHVIGITDGGPIHAIPHRRAVRAVKDCDNDTTRVSAATECGTTAVIARRWGAFARGNERVDRREVCPHCAWAVALKPAAAAGTDEAALFETSPIGVELALLTPTGPELDALARVMPDPLMAPRACRAILADRDTGRECDTDHERWARLLGSVTAHLPVVLMDEGCNEGDCEHADRAGCCGVEPTVVCLACSILTGAEEGEWEGAVDVAVPAPCSVLTALAGGGGR